MGSGSAAVARVRGAFCPTDMIVVALITSCMTKVAGDLLGIHSQVPVVIFVVTWLCGAVSCLSDFRHGRRPALKVGAENRRAVALKIAAGTAPCLALGWLHYASPDSAIWI